MLTAATNRLAAVSMVRVGSSIFIQFHFKICFHLAASVDSGYIVDIKNGEKGVCTTLETLQIN